MASSSDDNDDDDDKVGFQRPPKHRRFKKGQSGNPKGRPKGAKNVKTVILKALGERITITERGKRKTMTMRELLVKQLMNKGISGNLAAILQAIALASSFEPPDETNKPEIPISEADLDTLAELTKRQLRTKGETDEQDDE